jgi:hypothetical protein
VPGAYTKPRFLLATIKKNRKKVKVISGGGMIAVLLYLFLYNAFLLGCLLNAILAPRLEYLLYDLGAKTNRYKKQINYTLLAQRIL